MHSRYRQLPAVETLVQLATVQLGDGVPPHVLLVEAARQVLADTRHLIANGGLPPSPDALAETLAIQIQASIRPSLRPVINATGVIIQTNLGRAPLSEAVLRAMRDVGAGYSNLEYDLEVGGRGSRNQHLERLLCTLTGAEAALVVNNTAAAVYLALIGLAVGREVIVSRGQAVEIGGGFRIPDVLRQSGATLIEVGTTNRTYAHDYAAATNERTALLMRIHTSNFRLMGFVHETPLSELVEVGRTHGIAVFDDLGSGTLLPTAPYGLSPEPTVQESVAAGADLVAFSGDKLLGGPQAGLIIGKETLVAQLKRHPLARALRVNKTTIAGLEATLQSYRRGRATEEIPVWQLISAAPAMVRARAEQVAAALGQHAKVVACESAVGGGSLPGDTLPSFAVALEHSSPDVLATALRNGTRPVVGRIHNNQLLLDMRTVQVNEEQGLTEAVQYVLRST